MLLFIVAFISGLFTIVAPCIWPLLPIVLASSTTGGHRKPLGLTLGILVSFGILTLTISYIARFLPINLDFLRLFAVLVIAFLGAVLIVPKFSQILEGYLSRFLARGQTKERNGFWGGFLTGLTIGVVWTPCAGPILATIAALSITLSLNFQILLLTFFYLLGVGVPLFLFAALGRRLFVKTKSLSRYTLRLQQIFGVIMIITAIAIYFNLDKTLEANLLNYFPSYTNFVNNFEGSQQQNLNKLKNQTENEMSFDSASLLFNSSYMAPELTGITNWLNTDKPLAIASLKGKVVLVDFWTYTCINCIRTLPHVTSWYDTYKDKGFVVIGVHTPEFEFEKDSTNVAEAIKRFNIHYPVAQDNNYATWNAFSNEYWPAEYLIDAKGIVRRTHFGEGEYDQMEQAIVALLKEAGQNATVTKDNAIDQTPTTQTSPETYIGLKGKNYPEFYLPEISKTGVSDFTLTEGLEDSQWSLGGKWQIDTQSATTLDNSELAYAFTADKVYLVLKPTKQNQKVKVFLDGKVITADKAGADVANGAINLDSDRLYNLVDLHGKTESHTLRLEFDNGVQVFAFTFG